MPTEIKDKFFNYAAIKHEPSSSEEIDYELGELLLWPDSSVESVSPQKMVPAEELNTLKWKLQKSEAELRQCKLKLEEARAGKSSLVLREQIMKQDEAKKELLKERKKLAELKKFVATGMRFRPKRTRITLTLRDFAKLSAQQEKFAVYSDPVTAVGFQWKLCAEWDTEWEDDKEAGWLSLFLCAFPPTRYEGAFEFGVQFSFRLFNAVSSKQDVQKGVEESKQFTEAPHAKRAGIWKFVELKKLRDPKNDFLQGDGSIELEVDFTIESATLNHFF